MNPAFKDLFLFYFLFLIFKAEVEAVGEREADIEDGWGDDTWGGFETTSVANLAANLRLSEDKVKGLINVDLSPSPHPGPSV